MQLQIIGNICYLQSDEEEFYKRCMIAFDVLDSQRIVEKILIQYRLEKQPYSLKLGECRYTNTVVDLKICALLYQNVYGSGLCVSNRISELLTSKQEIINKINLCDEDGMKLLESSIFQNNNYANIVDDDDKWKCYVSYPISINAEHIKNQIIESISYMLLKLNENLLNDFSLAYGLISLQPIERIDKQNVLDTGFKCRTLKSFAFEKIVKSCDGIGSENFDVLASMHPMEKLILDPIGNTIDSQRSIILEFMATLMQNILSDHYNTFVHDINIMTSLTDQIYADLFIVQQPSTATTP